MYVLLDINLTKFSISPLTGQSSS